MILLFRNYQDENKKENEREEYRQEMGVLHIATITM